MLSSTQFNKLKKKVEQYRRDLDRSQGSQDELMKRLKKEFGISSIKKAKRLLKQLEREERDAEVKFNKALKAFEDTYKEHFDGED
jgi:hypothetical protein